MNYIQQDSREGKVSDESGLIKEALLMSLAIFFLIQAGFEPELLFNSEFWQNGFTELQIILQNVWQEITS
tara:strand:- start:50 stop:259 length:210 start_codon:yes stop_codon:yes gene_type:complete